MKKPSSKETRRARQRLWAEQWTRERQQKSTCASCRKLAVILAVALLLPLVAALTSCNTTGLATKPETVCAAFKPILISKRDVLTPETADEILAHNLTGAKLCGWKAKKH